MSRSTLLVLAIAAAVAAAPAVAETDGIAVCRHMTNDAERLACYDALFGKARPESAAAPEPVTQEPADANFGSEQLPVLADDRIEARLVGTFNGWSGGTRFHLDNGQVWRQLKNNTRPWTPRNPIEAPMITIEKTMLGYKLHVDGISRTVQVKRVR